MSKKYYGFFIMFLALVVVCILLFPAFLFATPIKWSGNGHYYQAFIFFQEDTKSWGEAYNFALSQNGYLVTITSQQESDFLNSFLLKEQNYWISAYQSSGTTTSNNWYWGSVESWGYTNWLDGEPNDGGDYIENSQENVAYLFEGNSDHGWNDVWNFIEFNGLIVEYNENPQEKDNSKKSDEEEPYEYEYVWIRDHEMTCYQVWINEANAFEFVFWWEYANNNWVKIYDETGTLVFMIDMPKGGAHFEAALPNGMYTVKTFHDGFEVPIQEFVIGKP